MEVIKDNCRSYICTLADFSEIMDVYYSRDFIHGAKRTLRLDDYVEHLIADILIENSKKFFIIGVRSLDNNKLFSFGIFKIPNNSTSMFVTFGGTLPEEENIVSRMGLYHMIRLGALVGETFGAMNFFIAVRQNIVLPAMFVWKKYPDARYNCFLHKILTPDHPLESFIDYTLLGPDVNLLERNYNIAILQFSLKQEHRLEKFKKYFNISEKTLKKFF